MNSQQLRDLSPDLGRLARYSVCDVTPRSDPDGDVCQGRRHTIQGRVNIERRETTSCFMRRFSFFEDEKKKNYKYIAPTHAHALAL